MSHQCSCGRDLNNNYVSYTNAYANANSTIDREANATLSGSKSNASSKYTMNTTRTPGGQTQLTAKVMFGTVGAIKELREKEKSRHAATRAGERRN
ncbi:uncharacterized protein LOC119685452 [Teleopsis dalmanni]|uniref:uncharacterized protein LOC119680371 n=1 Tax=Teleopsis dalmanni TaxID=139649 RepID=UPI0018CDB532|nr:uncharacterized protein LOC119680371 [Teleopsis dalmanni]XP_037955658.1 uncharacterized protein LOC119685452 [Teleopsis dalmanni]